MIPVEVINKVKIKRTRDQNLQTDEDSDLICSKCLINAQRESSGGAITTMN